MPTRPRHLELAGNFWVWAFVIAAFKLILISGNETIPEGSDSVLYFEYAYKGFWGWPTLPMRGPVYPLWIALSAALHVPFRLSSELLFIASAVCFSASLNRLGVALWLRIAVTAALVLHPGSLYMLDQPMSEAFFSALLLFALATGVCVLTGDQSATRLTYGGVFGFLIAALLDTRGNDAVLIYSFAGCLLLAVALRSRSRQPWGVRLAPAAVALTAIALASLGVKTANSVAFGVFRSNEIVSVGQKRLMHALMSIDPGVESPHKYIGVTSQARQIAYRLSPTLAGYEPEIESYVAHDSETALGAYSRTHIRGELDNIETLEVIDRLVGRSTTQGLAEEKAQEAVQTQIAREINAGIASGQAKGRFVIYMWAPFSPTLYRKTASAFRRLLIGLTHVNTAPVVDNYPFYGTLFAPLYDLMGARRVSLVEKGPLTGYVAVPSNDEALSVTLVNNSVPFFASLGAPDYLDKFFRFMRTESLPLYDNMGSSDVSLLNQNQIPPTWTVARQDNARVYSFSIPPVSDRFNLYFGALEVRIRSGTDMICDKLVVGSPLPALGSDRTGLPSCFLTGFALRFDAAQTIAYELQNGIWRWFNRLAPAAAVLLLIAASVSALSLSLRHRWARVWSEDADYLIIVSLLWLLIIERLVFYAFLDASIVPLNDDRHLFAANIIFFPALLLTLNALTRVRRLNSLRWT